MQDKVYISSSNEIRCINLMVIAPMVIFISPHVHWNLKPILVSKALLPKLVNLLKEKIQMEFCKPFIAPYFKQWFIMPKKFGTLRFI